MRALPKKTHLTLASAVSVIITSMAAHAQEQTNNSPRLEEIIVTAQKRVENLQEVPLSVSMVSGDKIEKAGIENLEDLTAYLPNIHFTETGISTQVRVRGIGSDNSQGFEQSVGMYIDGIYFGRAQLFRAPMMDMARAELLRGPQTTLFGKNSIAGALNLTTARPTDEFEGKISISHEIEHNQNEFNGVVSGPLTETLNGRLAVRSYSDDGYIENDYLNRTEPNTDERSLRLSLDWQASDKLNVFVKAQHDKFDVTGRSIEVTRDEPLGDSDSNYNNYLQAFDEPFLESNIPYTRQSDGEEESENTINNIVINAEYDLGENTLTFVSGWLDFNYDDICDCDYTASEIIDLQLMEDYSQFSQEIRIASPTEQKFEWIGGLFYQQWDQNFTDQLDIAENNFLTISYPELADTGIRRNFEQTSVAWSAFARGTWHINPQWHLTLGARITQETKEASRIINVIQPSTNQILNDPVAAATYTAAPFFVDNEQNTGHNLDGKRKENPFTPFINIEYDVNDDVMLYSSLTQGSKAGGFDPRANTVGFFEFEEEDATAFEMGAKTTVGDGRGEVNISIFRTDYDDLQISQFDGGVGFNPSNAKETRVQGIELDGRWALTNSLTASYGMAYLDFEYLDFKNGNCYAGQVKNGIDLNDDNILDTCDYTGKEAVYTPNVTTNISLDYHYNLTRDISFSALLDTQYVASQQVHVNLDPTGKIDSYYMVNLRLALESEKWSAALLGKNLLNEYVVSYSANSPLSESNFNTNTHYSFIRRPKTIAMEVSYKF